MADQTIQLLAVERLQPNPFQPRGQMLDDELQELADSMKSYGILEPLIVAHTPAGYQIIAGERRWRAAQMAGLQEVPVIVRKTSPKGMLEMALIENVQRIDLSPLERAKAFQQLMRDFGFTPSKIAEQIGKSAAYVTNTIKLLTLPDAVKDGLVGGLITEGHARAMFGIEDKKALIELYKEILRKNLSVRDVEQRARYYKEQTGQTALGGRAGRGSGSAIVGVDDEKLHDLEDKLARMFTSQHRFNLTRSGSQTRVTIWLKGSPTKTQHDLEMLMKQFGVEVGEESDES